MPSRRQQTNVSFLSTLMRDVKAKSASLFRFLYAEDYDDVLDIRDNDDDDGNNNMLIGNYVLFDDLWEMEDIAGLVADRCPATYCGGSCSTPPSSLETQEQENKASSQESTGEHMVDKVPCAGTEG